MVLSRFVVPNSNLFGILLTLISLLVQPFCQASPVIPKQNAGLFQEPDIFLTVSPLASHEGEILLDRKLELNWYNFEDYKTGDLVGLYLEDPTSSNTINPVESVPVNEPSGRYITSVRYIRKNLTITSDRCSGYWIAYFRGEDQSISRSNCLSINPTWMNELRDVIGDRPLNSIMVPGTHNAGSWRYYDGLLSDNILVSYVICQEDSIYEQLMHGIRFLDIRVAYYPLTEEKFWVNHDQIRVRPLIGVLSDIKNFVTESKEIVFVDFHRFPVGFTGPEIHEKLVQFVQAELGAHLAPKSLTANVTPNDLWNANKTVILGYAEGSVVSQHENLWSNAQHAWADTNEVPTLESYISTSINELGCRGNFWSAMIELTAKPEDILLRPNFGIRGFSALANAEVSRWYRQEQWYTKSGIVASDFYLGNNVINMSIEVNRNKASCPQK